MWKWIIGLIVIIAIAGGAYAWKNGMIPGIMAMGQSQTPSVATTTQQAPAQTQPAPVNDLPTATNDASDAALVQDAAAVDAQMSALGTDSSNSSQSLNDKPTAQEF